MTDKIPRAHHVEVIGVHGKNYFILELRDKDSNVFALAMVPTAHIPTIRKIFDEIEAAGVTKQ